MDYQKINSKAIDSWVEDGWIWGKHISHEAYLKALNGEYEIILSPNKNVPHWWIGDVEGKEVLGLASGGGQQMPIMCALGGKVTCLDYSMQQLEQEKIMAKQEGYEISLIHHDMTKGLPFPDEKFDIIIAPISICYIEKVEPLFSEAYRILKKGGRLLIGLDNGINFITNDDKTIENKLPFNPLINEEHLKISLGCGGAIQLSHTLEEQIGGLLKAGFIIKDIYDDTNDEGIFFELNINTFFVVLASKSND